MDNLVEIIVFVIFFLFSIIGGLKKKPQTPPAPPPRRKGTKPQPPVYKNTTTTTTTTYKPYSSEQSSSDAFAELEALFGRGNVLRKEKERSSYTSRGSEPGKESNYQPFEETVKKPQYQEYKKKELNPQEFRKKESLITFDDYSLSAEAQLYATEFQEPLSIEELARELEGTGIARTPEHIGGGEVSTYSRSRHFIEKLRDKQQFKDAVILSEILNRRRAKWIRV
ncbi:MAG: hypothetical protein LC102_11575 [Ignavibacteriales bacterium]|nr:MAG: hypothetical protein F9K26_02165 [Ignavibacteriaceae bacterium]MBW7872240.1 hypothetical protein [Ignavibacteria bacterium]MCZ2144052.1 hypothetical protein [Ignavibacteriales bacterium]OQY75929.1 MAG: hypothetical protein B6D45_04910 [Ignavibacteriales bacterium UTCHB3]MBV6445613.1 hypothetical protein [Ignavibacteriaceae bacterium]